MPSSSPGLEPSPRPSPPPDPVLSALQDAFGHPGFRAGQEPLVRAAMAGRDALGVLPTGGGKSVCYMLPALLLPGTTLVVSPLLSLMRDQLRRAREVGLAAEVVDSTQDRARRAEILRRAREGGVKLLLLSPERLASGPFRDALREIPVSLLAVDEAHCISAWGHDFRPEYLRIGEARASLRGPNGARPPTDGARFPADGAGFPTDGAGFPTEGAGFPADGAAPPADGPPVLALTATATPRVRAEIRASLRLRDPLEIVGDFDRPNLSLHVVRAEGHAAKMAVVGRLLRDREGAVVIYAATRRAVEAVRRALSTRGLPVEAYHAGLPAGERARVQEVFLEHPRPVVVATNAFGMGIDRADVRTVLHHQLPGSLEAYYQEAGRAGRDGAPATCVALVGPGDDAVHRRFLDRSHPPVAALRALRRLLARQAGPDRTLPLDPDRLRVAVSGVRVGGAAGSGAGEGGGSRPPAGVAPGGPFGPGGLLAPLAAVLPRLHLPGRPSPPTPEDLPHLLRALVRTGGVWADAPAREALEAWAESPEAWAESPEAWAAPPEGRAASPDERAEPPEAHPPGHRILPGPRGFSGTMGLPGRWDPARARLLRRGGRERLRAVRSFARGRRCRKAALLAYFGQDAPDGRCGACDRCGTGREASLDIPRKGLRWIDT